MRNYIQRLTAAFGKRKAAPAELFGQAGYGHQVGLPTAYAAQTGGAYVARVLGNDPLENSIVMAAMRLLVANLETVDFGVVSPDADVDEDLDYQHPAVRVLSQPGGDWSRRELLWQIAEGLLVAGNAVLLPVSGTELRPLDWRNVILPTMGRRLYQYTDQFDYGVRLYQPEEVAHLRYRRSRDGYNGIGLFNGSLLDELRTDRIAQSYTLTMLSNMGVPGMIFTPDDKDGVDVYDEEDAVKLGRRLDEGFNAGGRGKAAVLTKAWKMTEPRGVAGRLDLAAIRNVSEERVLGDLGVPPSMLGVGTGAQQTRVGNTVKFMMRQYAQGTLQPLATMIAEQLTVHLLPFYVPAGRLEIRPSFSRCYAVLDAQAMIADDAGVAPGSVAEGDLEGGAPAG